MLVQYTFEEEFPSDRTLRNRAAGATPETNGAVIGCRWTEGRWPGKRALDFKQLGDRIRFALPREHQSLTCIASLRLDALDHRYIALLMASDGSVGEVQWQIEGDGTVSVGKRISPGWGAGILQLAHANALGTSALNANSSTAQLQLSGDITVANAIRVQSSGRNLDGILKNVSGTNTLMDFGLFTSGGTRLHVVEGSTLILPNSIALAPAAPPQNIRILGTGTLSLGGDNSVAIDALSSFLLGNGNAPGPVIEVGNDLAFGAGTIDFQPLATSTVKSANATAYTIANPLKFSDPTLNQATFGAVGTGNLTFTGTAALNGDLEVAIQNASTTLSGAISGEHTVTKAGPGTLVLAGLGANNYISDDGTLLLAAGVPLGVVRVHVVPAHAHGIRGHESWLLIHVLLVDHQIAHQPARFPDVELIRPATILGEFIRRQSPCRPRGADIRGNSRTVLQRQTKPC